MLPMLVRSGASLEAPGGSKVARGWWKGGGARCVRPSEAWMTSRWRTLWCALGREVGGCGKDMKGVDWTGTAWKTLLESILHKS